MATVKFFELNTVYVECFLSALQSRSCCRSVRHTRMHTGCDNVGWTHLTPSHGQ